MTAAGHVTQVFDFASTATAVIIGLVIKYTKYYKPWIVFGSIIYLMGIGLMIKYRTPTTSVGQLIGTQIAVGIGGGMINLLAQVGVQFSTDHQHVAVATAVYLTCFELGGAVGSAISGAVWGHNIPTKLREYLPPGSMPDATGIYDNINNALTYPVGTPGRMAVDRAYQETIKDLLIIAVSICVPVILLSLLMKNYKLDTMNQGVKGRIIGRTVPKDRTKAKIIKDGDGSAKKGLGSWFGMEDWMQWP